VINVQAFDHVNTETFVTESKMHPVVYAHHPVNETSRGRPGSLRDQNDNSAESSGVSDIEECPHLYPLRTELAVLRNIVALAISHLLPRAEDPIRNRCECSCVGRCRDSFLHLRIPTARCPHRVVIQEARPVIRTEDRERIVVRATEVHVRSEWHHRIDHTP
jgi:hypothetical protein